MSSDILAINIEIKGDDVTKALDRLKNGLKDKMLMQSIGEAVTMGSRNRIRSREHTAPDGRKWESLAASTIRRKQKKGRTAKDMLLQEPFLSETIKPQDATEDSVSIGSSALYAMIHQFGGRTGRGRKAVIPARPYLGVSEKDKALIEMRMKDWIRGLLKE